MSQWWYIRPVAINKIPVPFCDVCGDPFLPKFKLPDGTHNPIFDKPEQSKRCGKCKTTRWNAGGVDRRRKVVEDQVESAESAPLADAVKAPVTLDGRERPASTGRCQHMLFNCPQCHSKEAA